MKIQLRIISIFAVITILFGLVSCGKNTTNGKSNNSAQQNISGTNDATTVFDFEKEKSSGNTLKINGTVLDRDMVPAANLRIGFVSQKYGDLSVVADESGMFTAELAKNDEVAFFVCSPYDSNYLHTEITYLDIATGDSVKMFNDGKVMYGYLTLYVKPNTDEINAVFTVNEKNYIGCSVWTDEKIAD